MKITITSTKKLTTLKGVPVRVWDGITEGGVPCTVFVHRLAVRQDRDARAFDQELQEQLPPARHFDLRDVLP